MRNATLSPTAPGTVPLDDLLADPHLQESAGRQLARLRKAKGLTQTELAKRLGVSVTSVCYWEQDRSRPKAARLQALSQLLGAPIPDLIEGSAAPTGRHNLQALVARTRSEIADAAGTSPSKVRIVIEM